MTAGITRGVLAPEGGLPAVKPLKACLPLEKPGKGPKKN
jgi:hypothetical protein